MVRSGRWVVVLIPLLGVVACGDDGGGDGGGGAAGPTVAVEGERPDGFPDDIPLPEGAELYGSQGDVYSWDLGITPREVRAFYESSDLPGLDLGEPAGPSEYATFRGTFDGGTIMVGTGTGDDGTQVTTLQIDLDP